MGTSLGPLNEPEASHPSPCGGVPYQGARKCAIILINRIAPKTGRDLLERHHVAASNRGIPGTLPPKSLRKRTDGNALGPCDNESSNNTSNSHSHGNSDSNHRSNTISISNSSNKSKSQKEK